MLDGIAKVTFFLLQKNVFFLIISLEHLKFQAFNLIFIEECFTTWFI